MSPLLPNSYLEASQWIELSKLAERAKSLLPVSPGQEWVPTIQTTQGAPFQQHVQDVLQSYRKSHSQHQEQILSALAGFFGEGQFPQLQPPVVFWLKAMWRSVHIFACSVIVKRDGKLTTIIPFPNAAVEQVAVWFCIERWMQRGLQEFASQVAHAPADPLTDSPTQGLN